LQKSSILTPTQLRSLGTLKFTEKEILDLVTNVIASYENRLDKARTIYKRQLQEMERIKSPPLWKFGECTRAGEDFREQYRAEYLTKHPTYAAPPSNEEGQ